MTEKTVRRWDAAELEGRKQRLERLPSEEWTKQDHYDAIEFLFQRYYPRSEPISQTQWESTLSELRAKVEQNLELAAQGKLTPSKVVEETNALIEKQRALLNDSYDIPLHDFERIVLPALARFPFAEGLQLSPSYISILYAATASSYEGRSARDRLIGCFHDAVIDAAKQLRKTYEILRRARNADCKNVKLIVPSRCSCLNDLLNDKIVQVADVLRSYEAGAPIFPPNRTPCTVCESPNLCQLRLLPWPKVSRRPGDDEEFAQLMESILYPDDMPPSEDWQQQLEQRTRKAEQDT